MVELDHIFVFTQAEAPEAIHITNLGINQGTNNIHPGQGTACKRFFFNNAYLELLWVYDARDVQSDPIASSLLWQRANYKTTGFSPFGICLRENPNMKENGLFFSESFKFKPPYLPSGIHIDMFSSKEYPNEPILFKLPGSHMPKSNKPSKPVESLNHPLGIKEITGISLQIPEMDKFSQPFRYLSNKKWFNVSEGGDSHHVTIEFDHGGNGSRKELAPNLPITITW
jgi:Glyoxalase-like domain